MVLWVLRIRAVSVVATSYVAILEGRQSEAWKISQPAKAGHRNYKVDVQLYHI
jgi:hypothetical protein